VLDLLSLEKTARKFDKIEKSKKANRIFRSRTMHCQILRPVAFTLRRGCGVEVIEFVVDVDVFAKTNCNAPRALQFADSTEGEGILP
jgi:hypothetical protein